MGTPLIPRVGMIASSQKEAWPFGRGQIALPVPPGPPAPRRALSPGLWERNVPEEQAGEEGKHANKRSQVPSPAAAAVSMTGADS